MSIEAMKQARDFISRLKFADAEPEPEVVMTVLDKAIAEAEKQEPAAWRVTYRNFENIPQLTFLPHKVHPDSPLAKNGKGLMQKPLYTHPQPKREWVGLTGEEIADIANLCRWSNTYHADFAHAVEAILRKKNGC